MKKTKHQINSTNQQVELQVQKAIRRAEEYLVQWIEDALENCDYPKQGKDKLEEAQFRNLVRVSETTDSIAVIVNFLRYQVGREKKWGRGADSLAERIIDDIQGNIWQTAKAIAPEDMDFNDVYLDLTRRYLGYGARCLKYLNTTREESSQKSGLGKNGKNGQKNKESTPRKSLRGIFENSDPTTSVVDEFIQERRTEVPHE